MNTTKNLSFLLADDHSVVRQGMLLMVKDIVKDVVKDAVFFQASTFKETLSTLRSTKIDIMILDIHFPDGNSSSILTEIRNINPNIKILIFSGLEEDVYAVRYINGGANGFLSKLSSEDEMKNALKIFIDKGKYMSQNVKDKILDNYMFKKAINPLDNLSTREMEIALLLVKGHGNLEISFMKKLQKTTVSTYKKRIFEKLNVDNLVSLIEIFNSYYEEN
jgi:DNA-binding NarL/FixJ family response regulator